MTSIRVSAGAITSEIEIKRPTFDRLWAAYSEVAKVGYKEVYDLVGGNVSALRAERPEDYTNACALRMSRAFNYGGFKIPSGTITPGSSIYRVRGGDNLPYIMRVNDLIRFVRHNWGAPDETLNADQVWKLQGIKGLIVAEVRGWSDASGHVTLWDGQASADDSNYHDPDSQSYSHLSVSLIRVLYWELK